VGDRSHPEIRALLSFAGKAFVIDKAGGIKKNVFSGKKIGIISQTTQNRDSFFEIAAKLLQKNPLVKEVHVYNTICLDTLRRQNEAKELAGSVDTLLIIGSRLSANTKRLLGIGRKINRRTYLVEDSDADFGRLLRGAKVVGLISGASTPDWLVKEVIKKIKNRKGR